MLRLLQSVLRPAGAQALTIDHLWWLIFWTTTVVFVAVSLATLLAIRRGHSPTPHRPSDGTMRIPVIAASAISVLILIGLLAVSVMAERATTYFHDPDPLEVQVTGNQWWWQVDYWPHDPARRVTSANELHLPTGRGVVIFLESSDVIHSFWVPALHGKTDLIPGHDNELRLKVDKPGPLWGQCAEYCGAQHAHMRLAVVAHEPGAFGDWLAAEAAPSQPPSPGSLEARGRDLVAHGACAMCHAVSGTNAGAHTAPDLTHFGRRLTIAAGTLPNRPAELDRWISDPSAVKPGTKMPRVPLTDEERRAVVAYLESLK